MVISLNSSLGSHGPRVRDAQLLAVGSGQGQEAVAAAWGRGLFFLLRSEAPRRVSESRTRSIQLPMEVVLALDVSAPSARKEKARASILPVPVKYKQRV